MALGDGIRRDVQLVSQEERDRFIAAILKLDTAKLLNASVVRRTSRCYLHRSS